MSKPVLAVIIGSVRAGRIGNKIGAWVAEQARQHGTFDVDLIDLREVDLPLTTEEPVHPGAQQYQLDSTKAWSERIKRANAVVLVTPEYNHGYPAALKNALDLVFTEWFYKPVGFASYGGVSGGLRAVQQLKQVVPFLRMVPTSDALVAPFVAQQIVDDAFAPSETQVAGTTAMLDELATLTTALLPLQGK